MIDVWLKSL